MFHKYCDPIYSYIHYNNQTNYPPTIKKQFFIKAKEKKNNNENIIIKYYRSLKYGCIIIIKGLYTTIYFR